MERDHIKQWKSAASLCIWHAQSIETLLSSGKGNPAAGIMLALLAEMARNESETLRERIKPGLALARKEVCYLAGEKEQRLRASNSYTSTRILRAS